MNDTGTTAEHGLVKRATGIVHLDMVTHGGLPAGGATLVLGEPGCGKTILGLQILASALTRGEGGAFMSFEESREQILRNADTFHWGRRLRESSRCEIIDAQSIQMAEYSGAFNIEGLLGDLDRPRRHRSTAASTAERPAGHRPDRPAQRLEHPA
ncbi:RAD55 family ATPase [Halomonas sp.]|uniref:RAD55 family ATPase n=1 Tax=Halomonas sp. TaxID=1486246 RepID=UPI003561C34D